MEFAIFSVTMVYSKPFISLYFAYWNFAAVLVFGNHMLNVHCIFQELSTSVLKYFRI